MRAIKTVRKKIQTELANQESINHLVDFYRGLADRYNTDLYEDSVLLETKL